MTREELVADIAERERRMADPLDPMYQEPPRQRVLKDARSMAGVIYKTKDDAHVEPRREDVTREEVRAAFDRVVRTVSDALKGVTDDIGKILIEHRDEIKQLRERIAAMDAAQEQK